MWKNKVDAFSAASEITLKYYILSINIDHTYKNTKMRNNMAEILKTILRMECEPSKKL